MTTDVKSIKIDFTEDYASFDFTSAVESRMAVVQSALVATATRKGSYHIYPEGGTGLAKFVTGYGAAVWAEAEHAGNFAALDAKRFLNVFIQDDDANKITAIKLTLDSLIISNANYTIRVTFPDGETVGLAETIQR